MKITSFFGGGSRIGRRTLVAAAGAAIMIVVPVVTVSTRPAADAAASAAVYPSVLRLGLAFAGVIALVYVLSALIKRMNRGRQKRRDSLMDVLEVLPLGPKTKLITVRLGRQVVVVGAGESGVNRITELGEDECAAFGGRDDGVPVVSFKERLSKLARK